MDGIKYRGKIEDNGKVAIYDYKTRQADNIPHPARGSRAVLEVVIDHFGVQNFLARLSGDEQKTSAVVVAGNSGLPGGAVGLHINVFGDIQSPGDLVRAPVSGNGTYGTQEEDVVKNWLLSENAKKGTSLLDSMNLFFGMYGMVDYNGYGPQTLQGVNFTNLPQSHPKIISHLIDHHFPYTRLYAEAFFVRDTYLRPKTNRKPDNYRDEYLLTNLVFVAGPNVGSKGSGDKRSTTRRTYNEFLASREDLFLDAVKWTYYAALHSIAMEGKRIALLPWISGALYAGNFLNTYGVNSDGSQMNAVINHALDMSCVINGKRSQLRYAFDRVVVVHM